MAGKARWLEREGNLDLLIESAARRIGRFIDLIDLVNKYVVEHQINVESTVGGVKTLLDRIDLR
jgi:hypothetical protein